MGIFTKLLGEAASNVAYKIGIFAPLYLTYIIGMNLVDHIKYQNKLNKYYFKIGWTATHYSFVLLFIYSFMMSGEKIKRKYHMLQSRKC